MKKGQGDVFNLVLELNTNLRLDKRQKTIILNDKTLYHFGSLQWVDFFSFFSGSQCVPFKN
jgi:hypothetical protein